MAARWILALGMNGELLGAAGGAPTSWIGKPPEAWPNAPESLQKAARGLTARPHGGGSAASISVDAPELGATVDLLCIEAIAVHSARTKVRDLLAHSMAALERQARTLDVGLRIEVDPSVPAEMDVDPEKLGWAISSLVGNSLRHVRHGTRQMPGGSIGLGAHWNDARREVLIVVADDGPGIPPEVMKWLFQRAPGKPQATGLALTVVRDIVASHGGTMELASSTDGEDHGTTVTLRLPQP